MYPNDTDMSATQRLEALLNPDPVAWQEGFTRETPAKGEQGNGYDARAQRRKMEEDLQRVWSKLIVLRDALDVGGGGGGDGGDDRTNIRGGVDVLEEDMPEAQSRGNLGRDRDHDIGWEAGNSAGAPTNVWSIHSQDGCRIEEVSGIGRGEVADENV